MLGAANILLAATGSYAEARIPVAHACGKRVGNAKKNPPLLIPDQKVEAAPDRMSGAAV
jgi:hypothetical protein